jgi:hypothetical protein
MTLVPLLVDDETRDDEEPNYRNRARHSCGSVRCQ